MVSRRSTLFRTSKCGGLTLLAFIARPLAGQNFDWARVTIGLSAGAHSPAPLWDVASQPILSSNNPPPPAAPIYGPDGYHLHRDVSNGITVSLQATHFSSRAFGVTAEFTYLGLKLKDSCTLVHDGGDPELATACTFVGSSRNFGGGNNSQDAGQAASGVDRSASTTVIQAGAVLRPLRSPALQPFLKVLGGVALTPMSTVALKSIYGVDPVSPAPLTLVVYQDIAWSQVRPVFTAATGLNTAPSNGVQAHFELRETFLTQGIVTGPTTTQNQEPPHRSVLKAFTSALLGFEIVLKRARGKRY